MNRPFTLERGVADAVESWLEANTSQFEDVLWTPHGGPTVVVANLNHLIDLVSNEDCCGCVSRGPQIWAQVANTQSGWFIEVNGATYARRVHRAQTALPHLTVQIEGAYIGFDDEFFDSADSVATILWAWAHRSALPSGLNHRALRKGTHL